TLTSFESFVFVAEIDMPPTQPDQQTFCVDLLSNNATDQFIEAANVLLKIANNIVRDPENVKYRTIRLSNATVVNKLLPVNGAMECLFEMGFEEDNDGLHLKLPSTSSLKQLKLISEQISSKLDSQKATRSDKKSDPPSSLETTTSSDQMFRSEQLFYNKLVNNMQHVKIYEDRVMQEKAKYLMPVERLQYEAHRQWSELTESGKKNPELNMPDLLLLRLLSWFKREFFSWMDSPKCNSCSGKTVGCGQDTPSSDELHWDAHTIELYRCKTCNAITRFPRYNNPGKLLETRTGRCGEWANCFTLCCRAIGFDSRYVLDWTDHVWTEVYSLGQKRWLHCDPCENVCDSPLTYDVGWKKELTYVIAFSKDEIQDVTWRYVQDHTAVMQRRRECRESWLVQTISKINKEMRMLMSSDKRGFLSKRFVLEIAEFMSPSKVKESDKDGRTSGSLAWRLARGETEAISDESKPYTFQPTSH
ncbi:NGLY1 (predicted), partial [Pycnogonum litorale]